MSRLAVSTIFGVALAVVALPVQAFEPLSEASFRAQVIGKTLEYDRGGSLVFGADGSLSGLFPRGTARGSWSWQNGSVCSQVTIGTQGYPGRCSIPQATGNRIRFVQPSGRIFGEATIR